MYRLENANSNSYTGIATTIASTSGYNWDEDNDCPCKCNIIKNHNFDIHNVVNMSSTVEPDGASPFLNGNICGWHCSWGSPKLCAETRVPWSEGITHAYMFGYRKSANDNKTEGFYQNVNIKESVEYNMKFKIANNWPEHWAVNHLKFALSNDSVGQGKLTNDLELLPSIGTPNYVLYDYLNPITGVYDINWLISILILQRIMILNI